MKKAIEKSVKRRVKGEARKIKQAYKAEIDPETGAEILDETPLFMEVGERPAKSLDEKIREITLQVQAETAAKLAAQNMTEEEVQAILDEESNYTLPTAYEDTMTQYEAAGLVAELEEELVLEAQAEPVVESSTTTETVEESPSAEQETVSTETVVETT